MDLLLIVLAVFVGAALGLVPILLFMFLGSLIMLALGK